MDPRRIGFQTRLDRDRSDDPEIVAILNDDPARVQALIVELPLLSQLETLHLHTVRDAGWRGALIAIGDVSPEVRLSLRIDCMLPSNLTSNGLRTAVAAIGAFDQSPPAPCD